MTNNFRELVPKLLEQIKKPKNGLRKIKKISREGRTE